MKNSFAERWWGHLLNWINLFPHSHVKLVMTLGANFQTCAFKSLTKYVAVEENNWKSLCQIQEIWFKFYIYYLRMQVTFLFSHNDADLTKKCKDLSMYSTFVLFSNSILWSYQSVILVAWCCMWCHMLITQWNFLSETGIDQNGNVPGTSSRNVPYT